MNNIQYITILGEPISQKRHRHHKFGTYDPSSKDKKKTIPIIKEQFKKKPYTKAISVQVEFYCKRPKIHYRTGKFKNQLKKNAPIHNIKRPDVDNYLKYIFDCCNGVCYIDDSQIVSVFSCKRYVDEYQEPYTDLIIEEIE
tara:strand:+ start:58 stop:480 length:423 start_codon:yes stop_codon:yes gene_type:complete